MLQPVWSKYVTMVRHNQTGDTVSYDVLYDSLVQFEPHVLASKVNKAAKNHNPLAFLVHSNASSSQSHANSSYSPQPYYVTHLSSVVDYEDNYQGELQADSQEDKLTTSMINQAVVQDGRVDIQTKNTGYKGNGNRNAGRQNRIQAFIAGNGNDDNNQIKPRVHDAKYFREKMLLAMKDEAGSNLKDEENDFLLDNSYGEETTKELTTAVMLMARIQPAVGNAETVPSYDAKAISEVNALSKVHEQVSHVKCKTIIQTSDDDQNDSNIIFDDPYVENNGGTSEHDSNANDEYYEIQMLAYNVQREAKNKKRLNNKLKKQKELLRKELETCKDRVKTFESKTIQCSKYKETCEELECELRADKDTIERILKENDKIQSQSIQTIHMLRKKPNKVYDPFLKAGLGYKNPERLKKAIAAQPKMYDGERLHKKVDCGISWKSKLSTINDENVLLKTQVDYVVKERENIKLEYQKLFNSIKATRTKHQKELDELIEYVNQKTYAYADVRAQNQDLLITISELKNKLQTVDKGNNVNTKFEKSETSKTLICVTPLPKNIAAKVKKVSNNRVNIDKSKPVTSHLTPKNEQSQKHNENVLARGMYRIIKTETQIPDSKTNINVCNSTGVESFNSVRRPKSNDTKSKDRVLKNNNDKRPSAHVRKMSSSVSIDSNAFELKSKNLGATSVVAKSRLSVAKTLTTTNKVIQLVLWIVDSGCSKHITGNLQLLRNFVEKFMVTVRFGNDHFAVITGYGDYVQGNLKICYVYYVEGLGHN
ncbi:hypothetical protein Tco_1243484 [Tanacetum coccineum]